MLQGVLYSAVLLLQNIIWISRVFFLQYVSNFSYAHEMLLVIFIPLQGFFNALIYILPKFRQFIMRRQQENQNHTSSTGNCWFITIWRKFSSHIFKSKESCNQSSTGGQVEVEDKCKEEDQALDSCSNNVSVLKQ